MNYNRDVEIFPVVKRILEKITKSESMYQSPTDMGVNRAGFGITDDAIVQEAAKQEVIRRYFRYKCEHVMGFVDAGTVERAELIMKELDLKPEDRRVVVHARQAASDCKQKQKGNEGIYSGAALELADGTIVMGKNSSVMHAASSLILNAIKQLASIPDAIHLLSPNVTESIARFKENILGARSISLDLGETLIALSISATTNPSAEAAMNRLKELRGCNVHTTHIPTPGDEAGMRKLGLNLTSDPDFSTKSLYVD